jgi:hypothetical protein
VPVALAVACTSSEGERPTPTRARTTVVVDGQDIEVAPLIEAINGLCQAREEAAEAGRARATYERRSRPGIDTAAQVLRRSNAGLASSLTTAVERVQLGLAAGSGVASLGDDLARLTELMREGLARLGITTSACER